MALSPFAKVSPGIRTGRPGHSGLHSKPSVVRRTDLCLSLCTRACGPPVAESSQPFEGDASRRPFYRGPKTRASLVI